MWVLQTGALDAVGNHKCYGYFEERGNVKGEVLYVRRDDVVAVEE